MLFGPAAVPAALLVSFGQAATPLDLIGMTGCALNLDAAAVISLPAVTDVSSVARVAFGLPDVPPSAGDLFLQYFYVNAGANALGVQATEGLRAQVR